MFRRTILCLAATLLALSLAACSGSNDPAQDVGPLETLSETSADSLDQHTGIDQATPDVGADVQSDLLTDTQDVELATDQATADVEDAQEELLFDPDEHEILRFLDTTMLTGTVVLPQGSPYSLPSLSVVNYLANATPDSDGVFELEVFEGDSQLAMVQDSQGHLLLAGFVDSQHPQIDCRSTAVGLAWFAMGGYMLPPPQNAQLLDLLREAPEVDPVQEALSTLISSGGNLSSECPPLRQALQTLLDNAIAASARAMPKILSIDPGPVRSGITLDTSQGVNTIRIVNQFRRKTWFWVERISYVDSEGTTVPDSQMLYDGAGPLPGSTTALLSSFLDVFQGKVAYAPKSLDPMELALFPEDARSTQYRITAVGAGYEKGDMDKLTADQADKQGYMLYTTIFADFLIPVFINGALPLNKTSVDEFLGIDGFSGITKDLISIGTNKMWGIADKAEKGDLKGAIQEAFKTVALSGTFRNNVIKLVGYLGSKMGFQGAPDAAKGFANGLGEYLAHGDFILTAFDTWVQASDLMASEWACVWEIDSAASKVSIEPAVAQVQMQKFEVFKGHILDGEFPEDSISYHFETSGAHGHIFNSEFTDKTTQVQTKLDWVWYIADAGTKGSETVSVEIFVQQEGQQVSLGKATAQIDVTDTYVGSVTPFEPKVTPGSTTWFSAAVDPQPEQGELDFHWINTGNFGYIAGLDPNTINDVWDNTGSITYYADPGVVGVDTLQVEIYVVKNGQKFLLDKASTTVQVAPPGSGPYKLAADTAATWNLGFGANDDLTVKLNGVTFYSAGDGEPSSHYPIKLPENTGVGDVVTIEIWEMPCNWQGNGERWSVDNIYLVSTTNAILAFTEAEGPWVTIPEPCDYYMAYTADFVIPF